MSTPITAAELAEIKARAEAATPGPWSASHRCIDRTVADDEDCGLGLEVHGPPEASLRGQFERGADARFIAAARDDVPRLVAEVERLSAPIGVLNAPAAPHQAYDAGTRTMQQLIDVGLNPFAVQLLLESVTRSKTLDAIPCGVSFKLDSDDPRHQGIRVTITRSEP